VRVWVGGWCAGRARVGHPEAVEGIAELTLQEGWLAHGGWGSLRGPSEIAGALAPMQTRDQPEETCDDGVTSAR